MPLESGKILHQRYRIEEILGRGGMGAVYRAVDINLGVPVAVKENLFITAEFARQFRREATILASLRHPNMPRVTDHFVLKDQGQYLVMDHIEGEDLREMVEKRGPLPETVILPWFLDICNALIYLHKLTPSIIHRDIKPGNIKVTPEGRALLVDFGLAKISDEDKGTTMGAKAMTPGYSPPEQYGTGHTDARTDVYSLAATMYATLTAVVPEESLERAMGRQALTPLSKRAPDVSSGLAKTIEKAMQVRPEDRYQSVNDFANAIRAAAGSSQATVISSLPFLNRERNPLQPIEKRTSKPTAPRISKRERLDPVRKTRIRKRILSYCIGSVVIILMLYGATYAIPGLNPNLAAFLAPATNTPIGYEETLTAESIFAAETSAAETVHVLPATVSEDPEIVQETQVTLQGEAPTEAVLTIPPTDNPLVGPVPNALGGGTGEIVFASEAGSKPQIILLNLESGERTQLTNLSDGACQPVWSPDGTKLLLTSPCNKSKLQYPGSSLWIFDVENASLLPIPTVAGGGDFDPRWSPDGTRIAFTSMRDGRPQAYVINSDGTNPVNLSDKITAESNPAWHPDGSWIVFMSYRAGYPDLYMLEYPDTAELRFTLNEDRDGSHPDFSADGTLVLFQRHVGGIPRLYVKVFEDRDLLARQVCPESPFATYPMAEARWSPDMQWFIFETWPEGDDHEIALIAASCGQFQLLTDAVPGYDFDPDWRPAQ